MLTWGPNQFGYHVDKINLAVKKYENKLSISTILKGSEMVRIENIGD